MRSVCVAYCNCVISLCMYLLHKANDVVFYFLFCYERFSKLLCLTFVHYELELSVSIFMGIIVLSIDKSVKILTDTTHRPLSKNYTNSIAIMYSLFRADVA